MLTEQVTILFGGDVVPRDEKEECFSPIVDKNVSTEIAPMVERSDAFIVNLECPLTNRQEPIVKAGPKLKANPNVAAGLSDMGISAVSLANNHILDYGIAGIQDTVRTLCDNEISFFGVGENIQNASKPFYVEVRGIKVAILAFAEHEFNWSHDDYWCSSMLEPGRNVLQIIETRKSCDAVVVFLHCGPENWHYPSPRMVKLSRTYIDAGASAVLVSHAHSVMGMEDYGGFPIFYGLGNLIFPSDDQELPWYQGLLVELTISKDGAIGWQYAHTEYSEKGLRLRDASTVEADFQEFCNSIADNEVLEQKWQEFCNIQRPKLLKEVLKGVCAMLPHIIVTKIFRVKVQKLEKLYIKGASLLRGLTVCENHIDVLGKMFDMMRT